MKKEIKGYQYYNADGKLVKVGKHQREISNQHIKAKKKKR